MMQTEPRLKRQALAIPLIPDPVNQAVLTNLGHYILVEMLFDQVKHHVEWAVPPAQV